MCVFISGWRCWPMFTFLLFRLWVAWPHQGSIIRHSYYLGVSGFFSIAVASIVQSSLIWLCVGTKADDGAHHCGIFALIGGVELRFSGCLFFYYTSRENDDEHIKYPSASVDCPHDDWNQNRNHIIIRINNKVYLMDWIIGANKRQLFLYVFCGTPNKKVFFSFLFLFPNNNPHLKSFIHIVRCQCKKLAQQPQQLRVDYRGYMVGYTILVMDISTMGPSLPAK